jgi:lipopolysaccharide transport system permease protein
VPGRQKTLNFLISNSKHGVFRSLAGLARYWPRLLEGARETVRQKYTGSVLGSVWVFLFPILQLSIFAALYTVIFKIRPSGLTEWGYVVLVFSGLVPLLAFSETLVSTSSSLSANKALLLNTVFPAELIPVRVAIASQISGLTGLVITILVAAIVGRANPATLMALPFAWILLFMFVLGLGWILSLLSLVAKDIQHALGLVTMMVMIVSPFAFTPDMVPPTLKPLLFLNPLSYYVLIFQSLICYGEWPSPLVVLVATGLSMVSFLGGFMLFQKAKQLFFDYA